MPRRVVEFRSSIHIIDEDREIIGSYSIIREVAIASKSKGMASIVDSVMTDFTEDIADYTKTFLRDEGS
jgi:hypothetical protein